MTWRLATAFVTGFALAIFMASELGGLSWWPVVTFVCGLIARYLLMQLLIQPMFGSDIGLLQKWSNAHPVKIQMWRHALAYATGRHPEADPLICNHCRANG